MALTGTLLVLLGFAAWRDVATRTIPDFVSIVVAVLGVASRLAVGWEALGFSVLVALAVFAAFVPLHARGLVGGADVKLLSALALGLSPLGSYELVVATALAGGVLASLYWTMQFALRRLGAGATLPCGRGAVPLRVAVVELWRIRRGAPLPYGVAIAVAAGHVVLRHPGA